MTPALSPSDEDQRPPLSADDFATLRTLIHGIVGIDLRGDRSILMRNRLTPRLKELGLDTFSAYCERIRSDDDEKQHLINAVTTNVTSFFREPHHFEHLQSEALPKLETANERSRKLRLWSAGCASGEEPYSIAMSLLQARPQLADWDTRILATDANSQVLEHAQCGTYELDQAPTGTLAAWLHRDPNSGTYHVDKRVRALVWLRCLNLMNEWPMRQQYDAIFCRNVTIYFDRQAQRRVMDKITQLLKPSGYLYLGHSESLLTQTQQYAHHGPGIYRKSA